MPNSWHPNPLLHSKLGEQPHLSLLEQVPVSPQFSHSHEKVAASRAFPPQDLEYLCEGLEGRSSNPVAVLFDSLLLPDSDFGLEHTSPLEWRYEPERAVPHLVLGKGPPGGAWHVRYSSYSCDVGSCVWSTLTHHLLSCSVWSDGGFCGVSGDGGVHAHAQPGQLDGAAWTQTEGLDERQAQVNPTTRMRLFEPKSVQMI